MNDSMTLKYREEHPMCAFCKNSYIKFMCTCCMKKPGERKISAKSCPDYIPTLEPISKRSLS